MAEGLEVRKSGIYGRGCFALRHWPARRKIALYAGELVRGKRKIRERLWAQDAPKVISITDDVAIDGSSGGDETAYINHSCDPNAYMRVAPGEKVVIFARRDIAPGEEITIDYRDPNHPAECHCGADNCRSKRRA